MVPFAEGKEKFRKSDKVDLVLFLCDFGKGRCALTGTRTDTHARRDLRMSLTVSVTTETQPTRGSQDRVWGGFFGVICPRKTTCFFFFPAFFVAILLEETGSGSDFG